MKRTSFAAEECPVARSLETVGDWWSLLIVRDAFAGKKRFGEFQQSLGIAKNILAARLKKLVADGVLDMAPASDGSAYSEYVLTEKGKGLFLVLVALAGWSCDNSEFKIIDCKRGKTVHLELRSEDGRKLKLDEVRFATVDDK